MTEKTNDDLLHLMNARAERDDALEALKVAALDNQTLKAELEQAQRLARDAVSQCEELAQRSKIDDIEITELRQKNAYLRDRPPGGVWDSAAALAKEHILRRLLWLRHDKHCCAGPALYGDDGEMQCKVCGIDFKRMTPAEIENRFTEQGVAKLAALQAKAENPWRVHQCEGSRECPDGLECEIWQRVQAKEKLNPQSFIEDGRHVHRHIAKLNEYNVARFDPDQPRHPDGYGPFQHFAKGGFTKEQAERYAKRLNDGHPLADVLMEAEQFAGTQPEGDPTPGKP